MLQETHRQHDMNVTIKAIPKKPAGSVSFDHGKVREERAALQMLRNRSTLIRPSEQEFSVDSLRSAQTARDRSCEEVVKYSVLEELEMEKKRMQRKRPEELEEKKAPRVRAIRSVPSTVSRSSSRLQEKENRAAV